MVISNIDIQATVNRKKANVTQAEKFFYTL